MLPGKSGFEICREIRKELRLPILMATAKKEDVDKIRGLDAMGDTAAVTVHINRLREKIEKDPASPQIIETVWGAGYRMKI